MRLDLMLKSDDLKVRQAGEAFKKAIEAGEYRVSKPFYDSRSKWFSFKIWINYWKLVIRLCVSRIIFGKRRKLPF